MRDCKRDPAQPPHVRLGVPGDSGDSVGRARPGVPEKQDRQSQIQKKRTGCPAPARHAERLLAALLSTGCPVSNINFSRNSSELVSQLYRTAQFRPCSPNLWRSASSAIKCSSTRPNCSLSPYVTSTPVAPSTTASCSPGTRAATTGVPQALASRQVTPKPSKADG